MNKQIVCPGLLLACVLLASAASAQNQPVTQVPMAPFAQWPPAIPNASTTPTEPTLNTPLTPAQTVGIGNVSANTSAYSLAPNQPSLAEAARESRQRLAKDHPRVFTNDDLARLRQTAEESPWGIWPAAPPVTSAQTMPAGDQPVPGAAVANSVNPTNASGAAQDNGALSNMSTSDPTTPPAVRSNPARR